MRRTDFIGEMAALEAKAKQSVQKMAPGLVAP